MDSRILTEFLTLKLRQKNIDMIPVFGESSLNAPKKY